jgi:hypothetical protein
MAALVPSEEHTQFGDVERGISAACGSAQGLDRRTAGTNRAVREAMREELGTVPS